MKKIITTTALCVFSAIYSYFFIEIPKIDYTDSGYVVKCYGNRYHTFWADQKFIKIVNPEADVRMVSFEAANRSSDIFLRVTCDKGLPATLEAQNARLEQIKSDMEKLIIPVSFTTKAPNYQIYLANRSFSPTFTEFGLKILFLLFINALAFFWSKK